MKRATASLLGLVLVAGSLAACGGDDDSAGGDGGLSTAGGSSDDSVPEDVVVVDTDPAPVTVLDNSFRPENIEVAPGTEVVWTNKGRNEHNVLHVDGDDWGVEVDDFQPGATYSHTFDEPGVYRYYCSIHGTTDAGMIGTIVVSG
ncbi:MAG TPA: plastocyanin/azurin family copper-binding protein [Acidimicrobiales bacterium]|nr:plastocyanin/azurin family copper-binding protein [Acidimicrobiales bacterium]